MRRRCFPKIEMSFWFFLGLSLFLLFDQGNLGSMCVAAVLLHELGHIAAMTLLGVKIQRIRLTPFGIDLERGEADSIGSELMIHLSGPLTNLCLAALLAGMGKFYFSAVNCALGLFELCPLPTLDGSQAIFCLTQQLFSLEKAQRWSSILETTSFVLILTLAGILFFMKQNLTLLFLLFGISVSLFQKESGIKGKIRKGKRL